MKNIKKLIFPSLAVCAVLTLALRLVPRTASAQGEPESGSYDEFDAYLEQELRRLNVPGASLVIVEGDEIVHMRGFGQARPGGETPTPQTPFLIGSTTKSFTALAVMQLVEAGQVDLDAPVQDYLPWFHVADPQASAQITVRHLLNQNSGLPQLPGMLNLANFDNSPDALERQVRALSTLELPRPVGSEFEYSNLNYNIAGLIVEAASGESYADYVQNHIFDPLEMNHSYTSQAAARQDNLAVGHRFWFGYPFAAPDLPMPAGSLPSGQLISSAEDMGHYLIAHLNGGRYGDVQVLSDAGIDELHRPAVEAGAMGIDMGDYGMGWFVEEHGQTTIVNHPGTLPDFFTYMALLPDQNKGFVLLVNANHTMIDKMVFMEVGIDAARRLAGETSAPPTLGVVPWTLRGLLLIPILQIGGAALTMRQVRRWRQEPDRRPTGARKWALNIALPLIPNLGLAGMFLYLISSGMLEFLRLFTPDIAWIGLISGGFALIWGSLRTGLVTRALRRPRES
ncbi:MAG: beta-lactamase family protein [Anaerolineae bacterium]|nr:beta-lactamase family protein [Anaerolineae bacterium]